MTLLMRDQENIEKGKSVGEEMMLMLIQKLVDNNRFDEIKKLRIIGNIGRAYTKNTMLEELADLNGNKGHAIVPAHLEGGMSTVHCTAMQLFVLDFDHESTFAQVKRKCDDIWLKITYAYHTYSASAAEERFRVVFVCEEVIEDLFIIQAVLKILHKIFPECDSA